MKWMYVPVHQGKNFDSTFVRRIVKRGYRIDTTWATFKDERGWSLTHIDSGLGIGHAPTLAILKNAMQELDMDVINIVLGDRDDRGVVRYNDQNQIKLRSMFYRMMEHGMTF